MDVVSNSVFTDVNDILYGDLCNSGNYYGTIADCQSFDDGIAEEGLLPLIFHLFILLRNIIENYEIQKRTSTGLQIAGKEALNNIELYDSCIFSYFLCVDIIIDKYIKPLFQQVQTMIINGILNTFTDLTQKRLGILIGYSFLIFVLILMIWMPFIGHISVTVNNKYHNDIDI